MPDGTIRTSLAPMPGLGTQTTKLADNLQSMQRAEKMLQQTVQTVQSASPLVQQKLAPLLAQFIKPLLAMGQTAAADLQMVAGRMSDFIAQLDQTADDAQHQSGTVLQSLLQGQFTSLEVSAMAVQSAATNASQILTNFQNASNSAQAALNTYKQQLQQEDTSLEQKAKNLENKIKNMTGGNCCDKIGHSFDYVFGHLKSELEHTAAEIRQTEYILVLNNNAISGLEQMVGRLGDISAVASSLEVSWRSMADGIGTLEQDLTTLIKDTSASDIQADLAYAKSDWKAVAATLAKVS